MLDTYYIVGAAEVLQHLFEAGPLLLADSTGEPQHGPATGNLHSLHEFVHRTFVSGIRNVD